MDELTIGERHDLLNKRTERWRKAIQENQGLPTGVKFTGIKPQGNVGVFMPKEADPWYIPRDTFEIFFTKGDREFLPEELFNV